MLVGSGRQTFPLRPPYLDRPTRGQPSRPLHSRPLEVSIVAQEELLYPPDEDRKAMREFLLEHLRSQPARFTASELVAQAHANGAAHFPKRQLKLELSRMLGSSVRMNPNRTLSAK